MTRSTSGLDEGPEARLPDDEVHLWLAPLAQAHDPALLLRYQALLTPAEQAQHARFHFERDRHRYLVTRALVRTVLSHYLPLPPADWRFEAGPYGRPEIANPGVETAGLDFNLSHSEGLVVCATRRHGLLGIDTEPLQRKVSLSTAEHYFSAAETAGLSALAAPLKPTRFIELWTLKESYIKARGMGLSLPLDQFGFDLSVPGSVAAYFHNEDSPARWHFWQLGFGDDHLIAVCAENNRPLKLVSRALVPLQSARPLDLPLVRTSVLPASLPSTKA